MNKFWHSILKDHVNLTSKELGIQIADWSYLDNWRSISLPSEGEIEHIKVCPCCGEELIELMTTTWAESTIRFIVGVCDNCGYIGYMTQPKSEWFTSYYENSWDQAGRSNIDKPKMSPPKDEGLIYFKRHPELFNFKKPLCEIGCGYGRALNYLSQLGFEKVVGVEPSIHRSNEAGAKNQLDIIGGGFDDTHTQNLLKEMGAIGTFYSHHVVEHTREPDKIIRIASKLQEPGGKLVLSVPNVVQEPTLNLMFFIPHLHAFSSNSLDFLLNRNGYKIIDRSVSNNFNLNILAEKCSSGTATNKNLTKDHAVESLSRIINGLNLSKENYSNEKVTLVWSGKSNSSFLLRNSLLKKRFFLKPLLKYKGYKRGRTLLAKKLDSRAVSSENCPIEFHVLGMPKMLIK